MARYCSDCMYLEKDKEKGWVCKSKGSGAKAINKKIETNARYGNMDACEDFAEAYTRRTYDRQVIYDEGKEAKDKFKEDKSLPFQFLFIIILAIIAFFYYVVFGN